MIDESIAQQIGLEVSAILEGKKEVPHVESLVRQTQLLPLFLDWVDGFGLSTKGDVYWWYNDYIDLVPQRELVSNAYWSRFALAAGSEKYPFLMHLIPARPANAEVCNSACRGNGRLPARNAVCVCGGLGWLLPGEPVPKPNHWLEPMRQDETGC